MISALVLSIVVQASPRLLYEQKCLYCHSEEVTESAKRTPAQWTRLVGRMRAKAPVLITRSDVRTLSEYIVRTLKLVPASSLRPPPAPVRVPVPTPEPGAEPEPEPLPQPPPDEPLREPEAFDEPPPVPAPVLAAQEKMDDDGAELLRQRCSKCHTLVRVFGKLDSYDRALFTLRRMRLKTGSGISKEDEERLQGFLRAQFNVP